LTCGVSPADIPLLKRWSISGRIHCAPIDPPFPGGASGEVHVSIYDVAACDGRAVIDGKVSEAVGPTVDVHTVTYTNTIGDALLATWWKDPEFDPSLKTFYYARVIEIPTPRWTAYDQVRFGIKMPDEVPMVLQERDYTSPSWYTP
jgi:hypothetical protein